MYIYVYIKKSHAFERAPYSLIRALHLIYKKSPTILEKSPIFYASQGP